MPEVFKKNFKIKVIEYGDSYRPAPFWADLRKKIKSLFLREKTT